MIGTQENLNEIIDSVRAKARVKIEFVEPYAGGQPATKDGLEAFVKHHLGISPDSEEFAKTISRINNEEIDTTPEGGELDEKESYGVNVIRGNQYGNFIPEHCIKAVMKQSATRMGIFMKSRGSKGDIAEFGSVVAVGDSLQNMERPYEVFLRKDGGPAPTRYDVIQGRVSTAAGKMSIQHHSMVAEAGSTIEFEIHCGIRGMTSADMECIIAGMSVIGIGSCLAIGYGKIRVVEYAITGNWPKAKTVEEKEKEKKEKKVKKQKEN